MYSYCDARMESKVGKRSPQLTSLRKAVRNSFKDWKKKKKERKSVENLHTKKQKGVSLLLRGSAALLSLW